MSQVADENRLS